MIRVRAYSRLHFGVLNVGAPAEGEPPLRHFGGAGLMVHDPGLCLRIAPAPDWSAEGPLGGRALEFARRFAESVPPESVRPMRLVIERAGPEHVGLGTGTQLGLAVARALAAAWQMTEVSVEQLAGQVGRGQRSGLGIHGFARGGFLVEAGTRSPDAIAPLVARADFPQDWRVVLIVPPWGMGLHGAAEGRALQQLNQQSTSPPRTDRLCRLVVFGLLPSLAEADVTAFGDALYEFNRLVGESFAPVQGGVYASPRLEELVLFLRGQGVRGVAQSSWGPATAAIVEDESRAADLVRRLRGKYSLEPDQVFITAGRNQGAVLSSCETDGGGVSF